MIVGRPPRPLSRRLPAVPTLALWLFLALVLTACAGASNGVPDDASSAGDASVKGGTMTLAYFTQPSSLDPAVARNAIDWQIEHAIYQGFLRYAAAPGPAGIKLEPCLATEVPTVANGGISADGTTYTFRLRDDVSFQPPVSRKVTAADFKYSFERMIKTPRAPAAPCYKGIVGAKAFMAGEAKSVRGFKAVDDATVQIKLRAPDLSFLNALSMECCDVVPREWVEKWGKEFGRHPLGTGPFVFRKWVPGREIVLDRNPNYWEPGRPYLDAIDCQLSLSPSTAIRKLQRGEIDVLDDDVPAADLLRMMADPEWKNQVYSQPLVATSYLFMNVQMKPFANANVRRALSWAINRDKLVKLQPGQAIALWQFYPEGLPGHVEGKVFYGYDPAKARGLLAAAGYPNGFKTTLYTDNVDPNPMLWQSVQADLAAVGVKANLRTTSERAYSNQQSMPRTLTAGSRTWRMEYPDPSDWIGPLFSKASAVPGGMNSSFWWSPKLERMYARAQRMTDPARRIALYSRMQRVIAEQAPCVPVYQPTQTTVCSKGLGGFYLHPVYQIDPAHYWKN